MSFPIYFGICIPGDTGGIQKDVQNDFKDNEPFKVDS